MAYNFSDSMAQNNWGEGTAIFNFELLPFKKFELVLLKGGILVYFRSGKKLFVYGKKLSTSKRTGL